MRSFVRWHALIDDRIKIDGGTTNGVTGTNACGANGALARAGEYESLMMVRRAVRWL